MELKIINTIRTNNFNDEHIIQKITDMWKSASTELSEHEGNTYGLYYGYASNYQGDYTVSVAIEGENEGSITIAEDTKYEVFKVNTDEEQGIFKTWSENWGKEKDGQLERAYTYDFEKYYPDGTVDIYIGVK
ncbi:effector binding domain-containing protein [Bacillus spongiae]|uniref:Effector binding domain-containing protein n=1 Tax=Bacillus spongiae TaxID=2683610 RepID=A0ABU8H9K4_9BACI